MHYAQWEQTATLPLYVHEFAKALSMRVLLIDHDPFFRTVARKYLERDLPSCELVEVDPRQGIDGKMLKHFDVVLLSHDLGPMGTGIEWLDKTNAAARAHFVYLTETRSIDLATHASRVGCEAVMCRDDVKGTRLGLVVQSVHESAEPKTSGATASVSLPVIDGYRVASQIGEGAMSRVYLAERQMDGATVVLKVIELDYVNNHAHVRRFVEEAELIAELDSPHVVRVFEQGFTDEVGFIAMEFFPRGDLKQRIEYGLSSADAVNCLANMAYGLAAIHDVGIVHRDLKPANVMFRHDDSLALADFGISRRLESAEAVLSKGRVLGTPHYMSPEQGQGKGVDPRNDLYSLGVIFFEMLTQQKPYSAETPAKVVSLHIHSPIPRLPSRLRRYQDLVDGLMAKNPHDRFQSAADLIAAVSL